MLKKLVVVAAAALAVSGSAFAQTAGGTISGDLPGGCMFSQPNFSFPMGTIDFSQLASQGYIDGTHSISAGCSLGVTGRLTVGTQVVTVDADLVARVRKAGECGETFFGQVNLTGTGALQAIPVCVRISKANPMASSLALGPRAITVTDPSLFAIAVQ